MLQAVDIEQFMDPGFRNFNNLAMSQLAILASLCLEEGHARLSMVDVIQKLEGMADSWSEARRYGTSGLSCVSYR
jgi:hypothetical protein